MPPEPAASLEDEEGEPVEELAPPEPVGRSGCVAPAAGERRDEEEAARGLPKRLFEKDWVA
jgi:hypothetical protein